MIYCKGHFLVMAVATLSPRALGALAAGSVELASRIFDWMTCVAYAMASGLAYAIQSYWCLESNTVI